MLVSLVFLSASVLAGVPTNGHAQPPTQAPVVTSPQPQPQPQQGSPRRLRVYLDCEQCFSDYLRSEIDWVDFVRQPQDADVHLLASSRETGSGGREYALRFIGSGRFLGTDKDLRAVSMTGDPEDLRRTSVLDAVTVGLLGYLAIDGLPQGWAVSVKPKTVSEGEAPALNDPWNLWVFRVGGGASFEAQESTRETEWRANVAADRVTEQWKISFGANLEERTERFDLDEDDPLEVTRGSRQVQGYAAKSLGPHWSVGAFARTEASDFGNTTLSTSVAPAIEYSVFPYQDYASRQLLLQYQVGAHHARYKEITLFGKTRETVGRHEVGVRFDQRQPWGQVEVSVEWSQYLHDLSKYRLELQSDISVRIVRGLSVNLDVSASRIRDQISLPRRGATPEEVLLRLRELQSGYEVDVSFSVTYSFGSLFNNVVNPRFGR